MLKNKRPAITRGVEVSAQDKEFEKLMATLAGRVVSELQVQSREKPVSVQVVKGYRELLYPESRQEGRLITTRSDVRKKGEYYRFYQPGSPSNQSNIDEKKAKNDAQVLTEEGRVKSIKIKL